MLGPVRPVRAVAPGQRGGVLAELLVAVRRARVLRRPGLHPEGRGPEDDAEDLDPQRGDLPDELVVAGEVELALGGLDLTPQKRLAQRPDADRRHAAEVVAAVAQVALHEEVVLDADEARGVLRGRRRRGLRLGLGLRRRRWRWGLRARDDRRDADRLRGRGGCPGQPGEQRKARTPGRWGGREAPSRKTIARGPSTAPVPGARGREEAYLPGAVSHRSLGSSPQSTIAAVLAAMVVVLSGGPARAAPDPLTCQGYPEKRVYLESQSWWEPQKGPPEHPGTGKQGHIHVETCFPLYQTLGGTGTIGFDITIRLHNMPGQRRVAEGPRVRRLRPRTSTCRGTARRPTA